MFLNLVQSVTPNKPKQLNVLIKYCDGRPLWIQQTKKTILLSFNRLTILGVEFIINPWCKRNIQKQHITFIELVQKVDRGMLILHAYLSSSDHGLVCICVTYKTQNHLPVVVSYSLYYKAPN